MVQLSLSSLRNRKKIIIIKKNEKNFRDLWDTINNLTIIGNLNNSLSIMGENN